MSPRSKSQDARRRLDIRLPAPVRYLLELAARASGESLTVFIMKAALSRSRVHVHDDELLREAEREIEQVQFRFLRERTDGKGRPGAAR